MIPLTEDNTTQITSETSVIIAETHRATKKEVFGISPPRGL